MSSDISDEQLERVVRRAIRAELDRLAGRIFWTLLAAVGIFAGFGLVLTGLNTESSTLVMTAITVFGISLMGLGVRTLLLKWNLPPYHPEDGRA